jgi:hypothetical protein
MATISANKIKYLMMTKKVDFSADVFKVILMQSGFTFNPNTQFVYGDVSSSELATGNGYTAAGATLAGVAVTEDDTNLKSKATWNSVSWTATGGNIGPSPGAFIYDDTISSPSKPLVGYIDFGGNQTQVSGGAFTVASPEYDVT